MLVTAVIYYYISKLICTPPLKATFAFHSYPQTLNKIGAAMCGPRTVPERLHVRIREKQNEWLRIPEQSMSEASRESAAFLPDQFLAV